MHAANQARKTPAAAVSAAAGKQDRVRIACEVASALVFLHSAPEPIVHMDLKPGARAWGVCRAHRGLCHARARGPGPQSMRARARRRHRRRACHQRRCCACRTTAGNLLLNRSLVCKVGDVGLSRLMPGAARNTAAGGAGAGTAAGGPVSTVMDSRLVGTPCYMDPEYLRTGRFGPKSDVYSLGERWRARGGGGAPALVDQNPNPETPRKPL
jgi:serine/threonine protein kinase